MVEAKFFPPIQSHPGAHPACCAMGTVSFPGVKRLEFGNDHPPPSSTKVKEYSYTSNTPLCLHGMLVGELYLDLFYCNVIKQKLRKKDR